MARAVRRGDLPHGASGQESPARRIPRHTIEATMGKVDPFQRSAAGRAGGHGRRLPCAGLGGTPPARPLPLHGRPFPPGERAAAGPKASRERRLGHLVERGRDEHGSLVARLIILVLRFTFSQRSPITSLARRPRTRPTR